MSDIDLAIPGDPRTQPLSPRNAVTLFALYVGAQVLTGIVAGLVGGLDAAGAGVSPTDIEAFARFLEPYLAAGAIGSLAASTLAVGAYASLTLRGHEARATRRGIGLRPASLRWLLAGAGSGAALFLGSKLLLVLFAPPPAEFAGGVLQRIVAAGGPEAVVVLVFVVAVVPPMEEFVFRGHLLASFASGLGRAGAAAVSTALFVAVHLFDSLGYPARLLGLLVLAGCTVWLRTRSDSLWPAVCCHVAYNAVWALHQV